MSVQRSLIKRTNIGTSDRISVEEFIGLCIDYREVGDQAEQLKVLELDYRLLLKRIPKWYQRKIDQAYQDFMILIGSEYTLDV